LESSDWSALAEILRSEIEREAVQWYIGIPEEPASRGVELLFVAEPLTAPNTVGLLPEPDGLVVFQLGKVQRRIPWTDAPWTLLALLQDGIHA